LRRIGLFGGSFDPVHNAHVALARSALQALALDEVRWIPAGHPWQKTRTLADAAHRQAMVALARHDTAETDPELGANLMIFFARTWDELLDVPNLGQLVPDLAPLVARLNGAGANQYRFFRFDAQGAIKAAFVFLRMDDHLSQTPAQDLALAQAAHIMCLWSDTAFAARPVLADAGGVAVLRDDIAAVIRAAYAPVLPHFSRDASHALRLWARL
jgi:cytidyltransferase-like protein